MLCIKNLSVSFPVDGNGKSVYAVHGADLTVNKTETIAVIGESGSGKSVMGLAIMALLPPGARVQGTISFLDKNLRGLPPDEMRKMRGEMIAFVPQSAGMSLNPTMRAAKQVEEIFTDKRNDGKKVARSAAGRLLALFGLPEKVSRSYPHQLSGGMRQRVLISIGLAAQPRLLIADEPTKGIDYQRKNDVIKIFKDIRRNDAKVSMLVITHDLDLARCIGDRVAVMYSGRIIEITAGTQFFKEPLHPYSRALLEATPERGLKPVPGETPPMYEAPVGCPYHTRCPYSMVKCRWEFPPGHRNGSGKVHCWQYA